MSKTIKTIKHYIGLAQVAAFCVYDNTKSRLLRMAAEPVQPHRLVLLGSVITAAAMGLASVSLVAGLVFLGLLVTVLHYTNSDYFTPDCDCATYGTAEDVINERGLAVCRTPRLVAGSKDYTWCVSNGVAVGYGTTLDAALDAFEEDEFEKEYK